MSGLGSTCCSFKGPRFAFQHTQQLATTCSSSGDPALSPSIWGHLHLHTRRQNTHAHKTTATKIENSSAAKVYLPDWVFKLFLPWERNFKKMIQGGKLFARISQKLYNFAGVPWFGSCFLQTDNFSHLSRAKILLCPEEDAEPHCQSAAQQACLSLSGHSENIHDIFISYRKSKTECLQFNCSPKNYKCTVSYYSSI